MLPKYIHAFPHLRSLLVPEVSKLGRARLVFAGRSKPRWRCWGSVWVKSCISGSNPASLEKQGPPAHCAPSKLPILKSRKPLSISPSTLLIFPAATRDWNRIIEWFGRDLNFVSIPCCGQRHLQLDMFAQNHIQPGTEHLQGWGRDAQSVSALNRAGKQGLWKQEGFGFAGRRSVHGRSCFPPSTWISTTFPAPPSLSAGGTLWESVLCLRKEANAHPVSICESINTQNIQKHLQSNSESGLARRKHHFFSSVLWVLSPVNKVMQCRIPGQHLDPVAVQALAHQALTRPDLPWEGSQTHT